MCELFGFSGNTPLDISPYLRTLMSHSYEHPHGWGIATFYGSGVSLEKEPKAAWVSDYLQNRISVPLEVPIVIAHIRLATCGSMSYPNCHPFVKRDSTGRAWTLAHNGTIFQSDILDTYRDQQNGSTDSERILCHIIKKSEELPLSVSSDSEMEARFQMMDRIILEIARFNKLNLMVYDGELLYVHTNMAGTLYQKNTENGILFATVPLDEGGWMPVPMMQLQVYEKGHLVYQGTKHNFEYRKPTQPDIIESWIGL